MKSNHRHSVERMSPEKGSVCLMGISLGSKYHMNKKAIESQIELLRKLEVSEVKSFLCDVAHYKSEALWNILDNDELIAEKDFTDAVREKIENKNALIQYQKGLSWRGSSVFPLNHLTAAEEFNQKGESSEEETTSQSSNDEDAYNTLINRKALDDLRGKSNICEIPSSPECETDTEYASSTSGSPPDSIVSSPVRELSNPRKESMYVEPVAVPRKESMYVEPVAVWADFDRDSREVLKRALKEQKSPSGKEILNIEESVILENYLEDVKTAISHGIGRNIEIKLKDAVFRSIYLNLMQYYLNGAKDFYKANVTKKFGKEALDEEEHVHSIANYERKIDDINAQLERHNIYLEESNIPNVYKNCAFNLEKKSSKNFAKQLRVALFNDAAGYIERNNKKRDITEPVVHDSTSWKMQLAIQYSVEHGCTNLASIGVYSILYGVDFYTYPRKMGESPDLFTRQVLFSLIKEFYISIECTKEHYPEGDFDFLPETTPKPIYGHIVTEKISIDDKVLKEMHDITQHIWRNYNLVAISDMAATQEMIQEVSEQHLQYMGISEIPQQHLKNRQSRLNVVTVLQTWSELEIHSLKKEFSKIGKNCELDEKQLDEYNLLISKLMCILHLITKMYDYEVSKAKGKKKPNSYTLKMLENLKNDANERYINFLKELNPQSYPTTLLDFDSPTTYQMSELHGTFSRVSPRVLTNQGSFFSESDSQTELDQSAESNGPIIIENLAIRAEGLSVIGPRIFNRS